MRLSVEGSEFHAYRGRELSIHGRAFEADGTPIAGLPIEIAVRGANERRLGATITRADGAFDAAVGIPPDLAVADYVLVVRTAGDAAHAPAELR